MLIIMRENTAKENDGQNKKNKDINEEDERNLERAGEERKYKILF